MTWYENKLKYNKQYQKENMKRFILTFHNVNDKEVIEKLNSVKNRADYIRQLILADIKKEKDN